jgi:hypothetical protein
MPISATMRPRLAVAALSLCVACGSRGQAPPTTPLEALAADSAQLLEDLRYLSSDALMGRRTGTQGAALARGYLSEGLRAAGVEPIQSVYDWPFAWTRGDEAEAREGVNVVGAKIGTEHPDRYIVLSAHYDHLGERDGVIFNGADDNASGATALLAVARALRGAATRNSILFVAFDAEESGLRGAHAFIENPPVPLERIAVDVNLDMVARTGGVLWAAGAARTPALRPVLEGIAANSPVKLALGHDRRGAPEGDDWTRSSDHGAFDEAGIPFVYFGVEDHPDYHRPTDDFENVDPGEYLNALRTVLMALLALDEALPLGASPDA